MQEPQQGGKLVSILSPGAPILREALLPPLMPIEHQVLIQALLNKEPIDQKRFSFRKQYRL
jgi:hypothetical protein